MFQLIETFCCHCDYVQIAVTEVSLVSTLSLPEQPSATATADTVAASTSTVSALHLHSDRFEDGNLTLRSVSLYCSSVRFTKRLFFHFFVINVMFRMSSTSAVYVHFLFAGLLTFS